MKQLKTNIELETLLHDLVLRFPECNLKSIPLLPYSEHDPVANWGVNIKWPDYYVKSARKKLMDEVKKLRELFDLAK